MGDARAHLLAKGVFELAQAALPIGEVASRCGYQNQGAFAERFLAETGLTPSLWRRQNGCLP